MNYYITTSIPYVNGDPHLGHSMEFVMADVLARYARQRGDTVIYSTGSDEHGSKNASKAKSLDMTPKAFVDQTVQGFLDLQKLLNISNDRFIRTTDEAHERRAQIIWGKLSTDIYKTKYSGWYDVKQEEFVADTQADPERMKPDHPQAYQRLEEENYFFRLSKYTDKVKAAITSNELVIVPETRRNEILAFLDRGLDDISISRPKDKEAWGIAVPGDESQVMYVWFEALMNYITVLGFPEHQDFKDFWPANVQIVGKDILRFHTVIWPAMLKGLGIALPKMVYAHGFINVDGQVMSKSAGNGVHPKEIIDKYGTDAFRYFFLRHIPSYNDGDFSWELFEGVYNSELANQLGNAVQRTAAMIMQYQNGLIGDMPAVEHDITAYQQALHECQFDRALEEVWLQVRGLNQYIEQEQPWKLAKAADNDHLREVLAYQATSLVEIARLLEPFMPETADKIRHIFVEAIVHPLSTTLFPKFDNSITTQPTV